MSIDSTETLHQERLLSTHKINAKSKQEELIQLLHHLRQDCLDLAPSPRKSVLEHAIQIFQNCLDNLLEIERHKHSLQQAKHKNADLTGQLAYIMSLFNIVHQCSANKIETTFQDQGLALRETQLIHRMEHDIEHWLESFGEDEGISTENAKTNSIITASPAKPTDTLAKTPDTINFINDAAAPNFIQDVVSWKNTTLFSEEIHTQRKTDRNRKQVSLDVYFFGTFRLYQNGEPIECWPKDRAKQLLKYLILNRTQPTPKEVLMDRFWPHQEQDSARNNLNVAVYGLRQALKRDDLKIAHVLFREGCYLLNPDIDVWIDTEAFDHHVKIGDKLEAQKKLSEAITEFSKAEMLYQGDFLAEDLYEDWTFEQRNRYGAKYLEILNKVSEYHYYESNFETCIDIKRKILAVDSADEPSHCRLMECFVKLNQRHLALRQYQLCMEALAREFDLKPSRDTIALYERIKSHQNVDEIATQQARKNLFTK
jgi:DNA-binding SARP family transcriptional activator